MKMARKVVWASEAGRTLVEVDLDAGAITIPVFAITVAEAYELRDAIGAAIASLKIEAEQARSASIASV